MRGYRYGYAMHPKLREFLLYTGVNLSATIVDYTMFLTLTHVFGWPILQSAISYTITTFLNYGMTRTFVFRHGLSPKKEHRRFLEYLGTNLIGLLITAVVIWVTVHEMGLKPFFGKTISVLTCFVSLYYVRTRIVFGKDTAAA
ncbi:GtrA family protein [Hyphomicrobium sp.]|uniref:GtrA family protein n=1 Tax=Hyphomicrobium sp. TaxID=82 RepID=UPI0025B7BB15|nr:GtrA family protein [Hyphomicrobium sp.]